MALYGWIWKIRFDEFHTIPIPKEFRGKRARHALIDGARVLTKSEHFIHSLRLDESLSLGERIARRNSIAAEKNPMPRLRDDHARVIVCS